MADIIVRERMLVNIPLLEISAMQADPSGVVFFLHGFGADKRQGLALGYELAQAGITCICPDAPQHGARLDQRLVALLEGTAETFHYPKQSGLDLYHHMHALIAGMNAELGSLISAILDQARGEPPSIGVTGFSMGGLTAYCASASQPHVSAVVSIAGIPTFKARWDDVVLETSSYPGWAEAMRTARDIERAHGAFIRGIDPSASLSCFAPKPLLIIHGDRDLDSPKKYSVDLLRVLQPYYAEHPDNLRLNIHDGAGHELNRSMILETVDWFRRHLIV